MAKYNTLNSNILKDYSKMQEERNEELHGEEVHGEEVHGEENNYSKMDAERQREYLKDIEIFNKEFERQKLETEKRVKQRFENKVNNYKNSLPNNGEIQNYNNNLYNMSIKNICNNIKNTWFEIFDEILENKLEKNILIKKNRSVYVGITIIVISILLYLTTLFFEKDA